MAKHKNYGKKPYAKFFKNKKEEPKKQGDVRGFYIDGNLFVDSELMQYIKQDVEMTKEASIKLSSCKNLSSVNLHEFTNNIYTKSNK